MSTSTAGSKGQAHPPNEVPPSGAGGEEVLDDDDSSIDEWTAPAQPLPNHGMANKKEVALNEMDEVERELAGDSVPIIFALPDGSTVKRTYFMGHTIAYIKAQLEDLHGLPYDDTTLEMDGMVLIDPLSLNDLPFKANEENLVQVKRESSN